MAGPLTTGAAGQVKPQFGMETYGGTNKLLILSPWAGVRFGLNSSSSLIFRYQYSRFQYDYYGSDGGGGGSVLKTLKADVNRLSGTIYFGEGNLSGYVSLSYLLAQKNTVAI